MNAIDQALMYLRGGNAAITSDIIKSLIDENEPEKNRMIRLHERYKASKAGVPIFTREFEDRNKINRKINNDFFGEIVDTKIGYFMGNPVSYQIDKARFETADGIAEDLYSAQLDVLQEWIHQNNVEDMDSETAKKAAICGKSARLNYIDKEGDPRTVNIDPWECIFIADGSTGEPQYAMRYYPVQVQEGGRWRTANKVEWYDDTYVTFFIQTPTGTYIHDLGEAKNPLRHMFDGVPLIEFANNAERLSDPEKVLELIDAYDRTVSDINSEIEQFRLAYMAFYGVEPTEEAIRMAQKTGAFGLNTTDGHERIEFITKNLNDTVIEHHLDRIEQNVLRFSKSVDFTDEAFSGQASGVAMKFKLFNLESKCITAERKFTTALRRQFYLLWGVWKNKRSVAFEDRDIYFQFKRNFPLNLRDEAESTGLLRGHISEATRLSLLSFVDDVDWEQEMMDKDREAYDTVDLDNVDLDDSDEGEEPNAQQDE